MSTLETAIAMAGQARAGQVDKAGQPYILHPLRVMMSVADYDAKIVAVLHDVIEDTGITAEDLASAGFSPAIIEAVQSLNRGAGESYMDFVRRAGTNPTGRVVKLADIADNLSPDRQGAISASQVDKYETARALLQEWQV